MGTQDEDKQNKKQNTNTEQHVSHINCESMVRVQIVLIDWCLMSDIVTCIHDEVMWPWNRSRYCFPLNMQRNTVICEAIRPMKKKKEFSWLIGHILQFKNEIANIRNVLYLFITSHLVAQEHCFVFSQLNFANSYWFCTEINTCKRLC